MNKLFIGLLIIAAGAGAFFLLRKNKQTTTGNEIQKELIIGKWTVDSLKAGKDFDENFIASFAATLDSNKIVYEFTKDGALLQRVKDSVEKDRAYYLWNKENRLIIKETANESDSTAGVFSVIKLNKDSLQLETKNSLIVWLIKSK